MKNEKDINRIFSDKSACRRSVSLARVQVEGLGDDELAMALAYEMEPYSSIPANAAEVAWRALPGEDAAMRTFDVAVVRRRADRPFAAGIEKRLTWLIAFGGLVLTAIACDYLFLSHACRRLEASLARRDPLQRNLDRLTSRTAALNREIAETRARREAAVRAQKTCARFRGAYLGFLDALTAVGGKTVVKTVVSGGDPFAVTVTFAAVDARAAVETSAALTGKLAARGWTFEPGDVTAAGAGATVLCRAEARFTP